MRHIAIISQGASHPSALWRTRNGTLGAIHKVHSSASRLRAFSKTKEGPESMSEKVYTSHPPHTEANSETSFVETAVAYAREQVPGVKL